MVSVLWEGEAEMNCPLCGELMLLMYGCGWDYDKWVCMAKGDRLFEVCEGEIELETSTYPEDVDDNDDKNQQT